MLFHHQNLKQFTPNPKITFKADAVRLDDLFRRVEEVTHQPLTDIYKLAAFLTQFIKDGRPGVIIRIQTMMLMKATYAMTYKSVCDITAFEDTPHHRALAITKTTELCRKYGLGTCPYADADCRHIHRGKAGSMLKLTDATPLTAPPSTWPSTKQKPYPNHISQRHRAAIGPMMGKVSPTNPMGISRNQVKKVYALQRSEGANTDSWLTGSIASGSTGVTNYPRLLMLRSSSHTSRGHI